MAIPNIPGFTSERQTESLIWHRPASRLPDELWITDDFREINPEPTEWVVIAQSEMFEDHSKGRSCYLIPISTSEKQLNRQHRIDDLGSAYHWEGAFFDGLESSDEHGPFKFFCQVRSHHGFRIPTVEVTQPFLWFWNAYSKDGGWDYLDNAGYDHPLIRVQLSGRNYQVEVRGYELRKFLAECKSELMIHLDYVRFSSSTECESVRLTDRTSNWNLSWMSERAQISQQRSSLARLLGTYVIRPFGSSNSSDLLDAKQESYPLFIIGRDESTGSVLKHSCNPDVLGTYFDNDAEAIHYLTPVYFKSDVLQKYIEDPLRYEISSDRLSCLSLWGISISRNTEGLIEVYLGDLGRDLPAQEWAHWVQFNLAPFGKMNPDRFRRDFLNQWTDDNDPLQFLRDSRERVNLAAVESYGKPIWRDLDEQTQRDYERLRPPATENWRHMTVPVLTLTKVFIDALNEKLLSEFVEKQSEKKSLEKLEAMVESLGFDKSSLAPFRALLRLRSRGGIAHPASSNRTALLDDLGGTGKTQHDIFNGIINSLLSTCQYLETVLSNTDR